MAKTFTVIYRTGGTLDAKWQRAQAHSNRVDAQAQQAEIARMGYKALIHDTALLESVGMPEGWEA